MSSAAPDPRLASPLAAQWRTLQELLNALFAIFAAPAEIAAWAFIPRKEHKHLSTWLASCERLLRKLLLIEAAALPKPTLPPARARKPRPRVRRVIEHLPDQPEAWRVRFRVVPPASSRQSSHAKVRPAGSRRSVLNTWPLAERLEALVRVFTDPAPLIRRLARRLRAAPEHAERIAAEPWERRDVAADALEELRPRAEIARRGFNTS